LDFKNFDWRILKKYLDPKVSQDLNHFLESMPKNTGNTILIVAAVIWCTAGALGLYTTLQSRQLAELRTEFEEMAAAKPSVPLIKNVAESPQKVQEFAEQAKMFYPDLDLRASGSSVTISAKDTGHFGQFREAIGHVQNGGQGWRVNVENMCVGRDCDRFPLAITLKVNKVSIETQG
jgi:hypothetical protein